MRKRLRAMRTLPACLGARTISGKSAPVAGMRRMPYYRRRFLKAGAAALAAGMLGLRTAPLLAKSAPYAARQDNAGTLSYFEHPFNWRNWSGLHQCQARALAAPADETAIVSLMNANQGIIRCVGASHSFSPLVPTDDTLVSLDRLSGIVAYDRAGLVATLRAGTRLSLLSRQLDSLGLGLRNLPDVDAQTLAGAISTGTHGTGGELSALHADVIAMRIVTPQGEVVECDEYENEDVLAAAKVSLGSMGVISQITLRVVPAYNLHRKSWFLPLEEMLEQAPKLARMYRHFEFYYLPFTGYAVAISHNPYAGNDVLAPAPREEEMLDDLRRLRDWLARFPRMRRWASARMIDPGLLDEARNRSWRVLSTTRLTRFNETEFHVPREDGIACVREVIAALEKRSEAYFPLEFRFVKADDAWLSPFYRRDSCSIAVHAAQGETYDYLLSEIGPIFRKYDGRPHWGKLHQHTAAELARLYPRWGDFHEVRRRMDPKGRMLNDHLRNVFGLA